MICHRTENLDGHLSCLVTLGTVNVAGPLVLLTQYMPINLSFEGLDLIEPCGTTEA